MFKAVEPVAAVKVFEVFSELLGLASAKGKILFLIKKKSPLGCNSSSDHCKWTRVAEPKISEPDLDPSVTYKC